MYFQVDNSPEIARKKKIVPEVQEAENPRLILRPFSAPPVVTFENVCINIKAERILEVFNPSAIPLQLSFAKTSPAELGLELSWQETCVEPNSVAPLHLTWCPQTVTAQRFSIQITDQKRGRYDVVIICKTFVSKKLKQAKPKRKLPLASSFKSTTTVTSKTSVFTSKMSVFTSVPSKKSPKASNFKRHLPKMYTPPAGDANSLRSFLNVDNLCVHDISMKYKLSPAKHVMPPYINNKLPDPLTSKIDDFKGRETYLVQDYDKENECSHSFNPQTFRVNKKGNSKGFSPTSVFNTIENMEFTPSKVSHQYYSKEVPIIIDKENMCHLTPEYVSKVNKENNHNNSFGNNIHSLIDNLAFTPVSNGNLNRSRHGRNVKSPKVPTLEIYDSPDKKMIDLVNRNNHMIKETIDMYTYSQYGAEHVQYHQQQVPHPNTMSANLTHSIIDLCDVSNFSKMDDPKDGTYYWAKPNIRINGVEEGPPAPVPSHHCYVNALTPNSLEYSPFTPNKNLSDIDDSLQNFNPKRCSTETKDFDQSSFRGNSRVCKDLFVGYSPGDGKNITFGKLSSDTFVKGGSPIVPTAPNNQSSPYSVAGSPPASPRQLPFNENLKSFNERVEMRNAIKDKNNISGVRDILEANLWQKTPPRPASPSLLAPIPEECTFLSEVSVADTLRHPQCETFVVNKTFEISKPTMCASLHKAIPHDNGRWMKTLMKGETRCTSSVVRGKGTKEEIVERSVLGQTSQVSDETHNYISIKSIATTVDPFLAGTFLYDERAYSELEEEFKMWLNYLLTPPADLETNLDNTKMDIGKAWIESRNKVVPAPTKEQVSAKYHTSHRLESLRKSAKMFIDRANMSQVFLKVANQVEKKFLSIRADKNIHLDIGLQKIILNLLMCYNPLWLRIGLETLYGAKIPLSSNDDFMGLSAFIIERLFRDPYSSTSVKHSLPNVHSQQYTENVKKFTLKKFLFLVYFLDQAKLNRIIPHDPCLFCRNAPFKESRQILIQFTKEVLSGVGDINKHLRPTGYLVTHKQTYLHEFKYAVHNLAVDLKDGVRLTRLMEIILMKENLTAGLRTPPISLLQKLHNVKLALMALEVAGFQLVGDITPKDIVDGHREKTLSLVWQLINQFRAPLFCTSAIVIQKWWRNKYIALWINKRIEHKNKLRLFNAATKIQSWWKAIIARKQYLVTLRQKTHACIVLQKYWRMWTCRNYYIKCKKSSIIIQNWLRRTLARRNARKVIVEKRRCLAAVTIQCRYRKMKLHQQLRAENEDRRKFLQLRESATRLQTAFRAYMSMREARRVYVTLKESTVKVQRYYRAVLVRRSIQKQYLELKSGTLFIQRRFRANLMTRTCQNQYTDIKNAVLTIQRSYRNWMLAKQVRKDYLLRRTAVIFVQQKYRATLAMRAARAKFLQQKQCAIVLETYARAFLKMRSERDKYQVTRLACIIIQQHYRAHASMKAERNKYLQLKQACCVLQSHYRARLSMIRVHQHYCKLQKATLIIQTRFRSLLVMKTERHKYLQLKQACCILQSHYRARLSMIRVHQDYCKLQKATLIIQTRFRSLLVMKAERHKYLQLKQACCVFQSHYRARLSMLRVQQDYCKLQKATLIIQTRFRSLLVMKTERHKYLQLKQACCILQSHYRARLSMIRVHQHYCKLQKATLIIQTRFRSLLVMKTERHKYLQLKQACCILQSHYRARLTMIRVHQDYCKLQKATLIIQTRFRSLLVMKAERHKYLQLEQACCVFQSHYRARLSMLRVQQDYCKLQKATLMIQTRFRSLLVMKTERHKYLQLKQACCILQSHYRARLSMIRVHQDYCKLQKATLIIQTRFRSLLVMKTERHKYLQLKQACCILQSHYRARLSMIRVHQDYCKLQKATLIIQTRFRSLLVTKAERHKYLQLKQACCVFQSHYRARLSMLRVQQDYCKLQKATLIIQTRFRSLLVMKTERHKYLQLKQACCILQSHYRARLSMLRVQQDYCKLQKATLIIQTRFRSLLVTRACRYKYLKTYNAVVCIQRMFKGRLETIRCQKEFSTKRDMITIIQRWYRSLICTRQIRQDYVSLKFSALKMQQRYRSNMLSKECRGEFLALKKATVIIQTRFRAYLQMRAVRITYLMQIEAVISIQKYFKGHLSAKKEKQRFLQMKSASINIQRRYRANREMIEQRKNFDRIRRAAIVIQRRYRAKKDMEYCQRKYNCQRFMTIRIQQWYRSILSMRLARFNYVTLRTFTVTTQRRYRQLLLARSCRKSYLELRKACTTVQSRYRAQIFTRQCLKEYVDKRQAVITIQKRLRAYYLMKAQREIYLNMIRSATSIQRMYRSYTLTKIARVEYLNTKMTVQFIQRKYRANLAMVKCSQEYRKQKSSAVIIQRFYRSHTIMKTQLHYYSQLRKHVITIQSIFKMKLCRRNYLIQRTAAIKIQTFYRMFAARRKFHNLKKCTILIQARFRSDVLAREIQRQYLKTRVGIIKIQSIIRQRIAQKRYLSICRSVLLIQIWFRTKLRLEAEKRDLTVKNCGAIIIQSYWRGYIERCRYGELKEAVTACQRRRRAFVSMRRDRESYTRVRCSVTRIQAAVRGWLARRSLSRLVEQHEERKQLLKNCKAATVIQKHWRGHRVRKQAAEHCAVAALRRRWREGALQSDQQTLAQRSEDAMDVLCHFQDVASVIRAFKTLDYVTNVYPMMYGSRETALPLVTRLVAYMGSTNRSVSTLETLQLGVAILLNLTKFSPTAHYVYKVEYLNTMLTLMLRWCDKDSQLCRLFCTLLWMFGKYNDIREEMRMMLRNGEPYKMLSKIRCSLVRKRRMDSRKRTSHPVAPSPLNSSGVHQLSRSFLDSSFLSRVPPCSTPLRPRHHTPLSPSTEPDYGISRSDHPRIFQDEIQAMDAVFFKFDLPLNFIAEN